MRGGTSGRSQSDPLGRVKLGRIKVIHYSTATSKYCCMCRVLRKESNVRNTFNYGQCQVNCFRHIGNLRYADVGNTRVWQEPI